jgi:hypothetical protein
MPELIKHNLSANPTHAALPQPRFDLPRLLATPLRAGGTHHEAKQDAQLARHLHTNPCELARAASDCVETFLELEDSARDREDERAAHMTETQRGLTQTYSKLKDPTCTDPEILHLRTLHEDMDAAVLRAYGWPEIQVPPFCPLTAEDQKSLETFQDQVIDHLFVLNAERAKEEARLGAASKKASKAKPTNAKKPKPPPDQGSLF